MAIDQKKNTKFVKDKHLLKLFQKEQIVKKQDEETSNEIKKLLSNLRRKKIEEAQAGKDIQNYSEYFKYRRLTGHKKPSLVNYQNRNSSVLSPLVSS